MSDKASQILIIGAGISGLSAALALSKFVSPAPQITICEARPTLPSLGGAVNITPNGQRYLWHLGALDAVRANGAGADVRAIDIFARDSGASMGGMSFTHPDGRGMGEPAFHAVRIRRVDLLNGMLARCQALDNISVKFGLKVIAMEQDEHSVTVNFAGGLSETADLLLGCDGIHSGVRSTLQPDRQPRYTGVTIVNGYTAELPQDAWLPERDTSFLWTPSGSFLSTYFQQARDKLYLVGLWETADVPSREGWQAKGKDQDALQAELKKRFGRGAFQGVNALIDGVAEWSLYPVYNLPPRGTWSLGRTQLLGDAAHAMSPQGESATIAIEDSIIFARTLAKQGDRPLTDVFEAYERNRRERVEANYKEADWRWNMNKDSGWAAGKVQEWLTPVFLWATSGKRKRAWEEDLTSVNLE